MEADEAKQQALQEKKEAAARKKEAAAQKKEAAAAVAAQKKKEAAPKKEGGGKAASSKKEEENLLGITVKKSENFSEWYTQLIKKSEMIEYYDISGCYILRPWSYQIWEKIVAFFDGKIKDDGVENAYFPLLVSKARLETEKDHIEGFAPEVAWVTQAGQSNLAEPVAIRPTSETIIYPTYAQWIRSHRDLPMRLNQWCNVLRWEFKSPVPFLRSREFLWSEGHSVYAKKEEADVEVLVILEFYRQVYEEVLAVPVIRGFKSEGEKFAGGLYTTSIEAFIPTNGRGIQAATSHCLGQNFSKMFNISFEDEHNKSVFAWQNSWGLTTRTIGIMSMVHGDDKGLVLPPRVAPLQVVIVPIYYKGVVNEDVLNTSNRIVTELKAKGLRVRFDDRLNYQFGWKFNHWELKGVPVRLELGPRDLEAKSIFVYRRDTNSKEKVAIDGVVEHVANLLDEIQRSLLESARALRDSRISVVTKWEEFVPSLDKGNIVRAPWCEREACEKDVGKRSGEEAKARQQHQEDEGVNSFKLTAAAKSLCIPLEQEPLPEGANCFACETAAKRWTMFGRSY